MEVLTVMVMGTVTAIRHSARMELGMEDMVTEDMGMVLEVMVIVTEVMAMDFITDRIGMVGIGVIHIMVTTPPIGA